MKTAPMTAPARTALAPTTAAPMRSTTRSVVRWAPPASGTTDTLAGTDSPVDTDPHAGVGTGLATGAAEAGSATGIGRPAAADRHPGAPAFRLSVVIPSYCEPRIGDTVRRVRAELAPAGLLEDLEIIVVDDGSPDDSHAAAVEAGADQVIVLEQNRGKGAAVRQGMLAARGRVIAFTDADLSYAPIQLLALLEQAEAGWDVVVGNRAHPDSQALGSSAPGRAIGSRCINRLIRTVLPGASHRLEDTQCGLKALRADAARSVFAHSRIDGFAFDVEVLYLADRFSLGVVDVPVTVANSPRSTVNVGRDALRLARDLLRIRRWGRHAYEQPALDVRAHRVLLAH